MAKNRKRLGDLYVRGAELTVSDGDHEESVWIQKPNPVQHEAMLRIANAARSKVTMRFKDKQSEEYLAALDEISDMFPERDDRVSYLVEIELGEIRPKIEEELALDEDGEWSQDNYLEGLREAWEDGMSRRYAMATEEEPDEEASTMFSELKRFNNEVEKIVDTHRKKLERDYNQCTDSKVDDLVVEKHLNHKGTQAWFAAYRRAQIRYSVREIQDHGQYYFETLEEVEALALPVLKALFEKIEQISVDPLEGKD